MDQASLEDAFVALTGPSTAADRAGGAPERPAATRMAARLALALPLGADLLAFGLPASHAASRAPDFGGGRRSTPYCRRSAVDRVRRCSASARCPAYLADYRERGVLRAPRARRPRSRRRLLAAQLACSVAWRSPRSRSCSSWRRRVRHLPAGQRAGRARARVRARRRVALRDRAADRRRRARPRDGETSRHAAVLPARCSSPACTSPARRWGIRSAISDWTPLGAAARRSRTRGRAARRSAPARGDRPGAPVAGSCGEGSSAGSDTTTAVAPLGAHGRTASSARSRSSCWRLSRLLPDRGRRTTGGSRLATRRRRGALWLAVHAPRWHGAAAWRAPGRAADPVGGARAHRPLYGFFAFTGYLGGRRLPAAAGLATSRSSRPRSPNGDRPVGGDPAARRSSRVWLVASSSGQR